jgi:NAD(P)H-flavin reductase
MVQKFEETIRKGSIDQIEMISDTVARVVVRTLTAQEPLSYLPGQFARLILSNGVSRDYSMANLTGDARRLEFLIRIYADGQFSSYIGNQARAGEQITVEGPRGKFILRDHDRIPVFIVGGTGLAPALAMLRHFARTDPQRRALLFFGNTNPGDVFCAEELKELQEQMPHLEIYTTVINADPAWTGETGVVTDVAERVLDRTSEYEYYYCGPPVMIQATTKMLERLGVAREYRHHEDFVPSAKESNNG